MRKPHQRVNSVSAGQRLAWLWLEEHEDKAVLSCGCTPHRDYANSGDPAFDPCPFHLSLFKHKPVTPTKRKGGILPRFCAGF